MDTRFWLERWQENNIAFHQSDVNPLLRQYFDALSLVAGSRVFLPLCGKTLDIAWLLSNGLHVVGAELSEMAVEQLFVQLELEPEISAIGGLQCYSGKDIDILVGDIFHVSGEILGPVDAIYDRAALVALPDAMRKRYAAHLMGMTETAPQLLLCYEYDQSLMKGPPFSVSNREVEQHYGDAYDLRLIESVQVPGGLKGQGVATENVWLLGAQRSW